MRKRIYAVALFVAAVAGILVLLGVAPPQNEAKAGQVTISPCAVKTTAGEFRGFASRVWRLSRWERGKPKKDTLAAMRHMRRCAAGVGHRRAMKHAWKQDKSAYFQHRQAMLEERQLEREEAAYEAAVSPPGMATLEAIAACESGGDPTAVSSDGTYRGKYQFDYGTWESVGGSGDPAAAPEREQDERAAALYNASGSSPWPVCG